MGAYLKTVGLYRCAAGSFGRGSGGIASQYLFTFHALFMFILPELPFPARISDGCER